MCFLTHFITNELHGDGKNIVLLLQWFYNMHQNNNVSFHLEKECKGMYMECKVAHMEFSRTLRSEPKQTILHCKRLFNWKVNVTSK